jgi:hypothetical protein
LLDSAKGGVNALRGMIGREAGDSAIANAENSPPRGVSPRAGARDFAGPIGARRRWKDHR